MRIGQGYDVHKLAEDRELILGGVTVPYEKGLLGHSDADVLCHAVSDALLGAMAWGDIGKWFPDDQERYRGADSLQLLAKIGCALEEAGQRIDFVDACIIAQKPKLSPYIEDMRRNIAKALNMDVLALSVKATTSESLGFTGREEGMACRAVATLRGPLCQRPDLAEDEGFASADD